MKKRYKERGYINWIKSRNIKAAKRKRTHFKRLEARKLASVKKARAQRYKNFTKVIAPHNLSLLNNTESVNFFIAELKSAYDNNEKTLVVLNQVDEIDYGSIVVLLSVMIKFKSKGLDFDGTLPENKQAKKKLINSGFFSNLFKHHDENDYYEISPENGGNICTHAQKKVDSELGDRLIQQASKFIWGNEKRCPGVQRTLIELMQNTNNHADAEKLGEKHWWLSVSFDEVNHSVSFAFVDFGVGIFENLKNPTQKNMLKNLTEKLSELFHFNDNAELLSMILSGQLHKTVTGKKYRGKGLPGVAQACERKQIRNLRFITNDVSADVNKGLFELLEMPFHGTFVYWELDATNENFEY